MDSPAQAQVINNRDTPTPAQPEILRSWLTYFLQTIRQEERDVLLPSAPTDWPQFISAIDFHQLAPLLYWSLQARPNAVQPPPTVMQQLRANQIKATIQSLQRTQELRTILAALNAAGIRPTLYKGSALAYTVYPSPVCRTMGDLDLWVRSEEMATAQATIESLGYHPKLKTERPFALQGQSDGEIQLLGQGIGKGLIELHWGVFAGQWLHRAATIDREAIRRRSVATELFDTPIYLLANEDAVIQVAVHLGINHQLSLHPLRSLLDIALLDQQKLDWAVVIERVRQWRLATVMSVVLDLLISIFGAAELSPGANAAAAALHSTTHRHLFRKRWRNPAILFNQTKISASRNRFFYLLNMVDKPTDTLYLFMRTLWPEDEWLVARYGNANSAVRLQHIKSACQGKL